jgi:hypothetical protein
MQQRAVSDAALAADIADLEGRSEDAGPAGDLPILPSDKVRCEAIGVPAGWC